MVLLFLHKYNYILSSAGNSPAGQQEVLNFVLLSRKPKFFLDSLDLSNFCKITFG